MFAEVVYIFHRLLSSDRWFNAACCRCFRFCIGRNVDVYANTLITSFVFSNMIRMKNYLEYFLKCSICHQLFFAHLSLYSSIDRRCVRHEVNAPWIFRIISTFLFFGEMWRENKEHKSWFMVAFFRLFGNNLSKLICHIKLKLITFAVFFCMEKEHERVPVSAIGMKKRWEFVHIEIFGDAIDMFRINQMESFSNFCQILFSQYAWIFAV